MNNQTETISRRKFIKAALFAGASALTGYGLSQSPTNVRYLPDEPSASDQLNATATAVARRGETTSFHEEGGYSQEIFEQIRRSTFAVELRGDKAIAIGTAWLAGNNNGRLQFVTNRHLYSGAGKSVYDIRLWRPSFDNYPLATNQFNIVTTEQGLDIAVINCNAINFADELQPLAWKEQRIPKLGSRTLIVGYPANFKMSGGNYITYGSVLTTEKYTDKGIWISRGAIAGGGSGSPVVALDESNKPYVTGMVFGGSTPEIKTQSGNRVIVQKQSVVVASTLVVEHLMK